MEQSIKRKKKGSSKPAESRRDAARDKKKKRWRIVKRIFSVLFSTLLSIFLICIITSTIVGTAAAVYVLDIMEDSSTITLEEMELAYNTSIYGYDLDGNLQILYQVTNEVQRIPVSDIKDIPQHVLDAFVYTEDERFYSHDGVDYKNTIAACLNLVLNFWDTDRGGSTITQQLIKNVTGDDEQSPSRKIREIFRAMTLEKNYSKDDIILTYLNFIGFGGKNNGIEMAAIDYFGKNVGELTVAEAACLAAIPQSPEAINPRASQERNRARQEYVLWQMYEHGALSYDDYQDALNEHMLFAFSDEYKRLHPDEAKEYNPDEAATSWVIDAAIYEFRDYLMETYNYTREQAYHQINTGGFQIYTTVDPKMQTYVEEKYLSLDNLISTRNSARYNEDTNGDGEITQEDDPVYPQATFIALNYEGEILACVGAIGEKEGALITNYATDEPRQPGSTIKPVAGYGYGIYSDEFQWGSMIKDYGLTMPDGSIWPKNYSSNSVATNYSGKDLHMYYGLMKSLNTISARLVDALTPEAVFKFASENMGLKLTEIDAGGKTDMALSPLSVGALTYGVTLENMVNAYIPYGNGGTMYKAHIISRVEQGNHQLVYENDGDPYEAIDPQTAYIMNRMMKNVVSSEGTAGAAQLSKKDVVGKTGTTQNWDDLWFIGLTEDFVSGVWIGYVQREKLDTSISSARMWYNAIGEYANSIESDAEYPVPEEGIVEGHVCTNTGKIAGKSCPMGEVGYWKEELAEYCSGCYKPKETRDPSATSAYSGDDTGESGEAYPPVDVPQNPVEPTADVPQDPVEPPPVDDPPAPPIPEIPEGGDG